MTDRAVVIGASMAGLLAARVLTDFFDRVTVFDRDTLPDTAAPRRGVPHDRHAHGLLVRGREILEELFPGLSADLVAKGAVTGDMQADFRWYNDGLRLVPGRSGLTALGVSRPLLERYVRARVGALPTVEILDRHDVTSPAIASDRRSVTGVRMLPGTDGQSDDVVPATLVVDASGRGSRSPGWLERLGYPRPTEERIRVKVVYVTRIYRREPRHLEGGTGVSVGAIPPWLPRGGVVVPLEGDRWMVTLAGALGVEPPVDPEGFAAFAATLAVPDIAELLRDAQPLDEPVRARFPASVRRRYEDLPTFPEGYLVVGDAICSLNPVYAQGMTIAAAEALALRDCLRRGRSRLASRFFGHTARLIDVPWSLAAGNDLRFPEVEGARPLQQRLVNRYISRLHVAAEHDPAIGRAFLRVTNLLDRPERLFAPDNAWRVLRGNLRGQAAADPPATYRGEGRLRVKLTEEAVMTTVSKTPTMVENRAATVAQMFRDRVRQTPDREAYRYPVGADWISRTWGETGRQVTRLAAGLIALGIEPEQRVAIASATRYEWVLADLAVMCAAAATTTVYPSAIAEDVAFILADSESRIVFADNDDQIGKLREGRDQLPLVRAVVTFDGTPDDGDDPWVISLARLAELGAAHLATHPEAIEQRVGAIRPEHLATLIYTSGTTGRAKGVRLRHSAWTYEGAAVAALGLLGIDDLQYLWLPMAHSFGKVLLTLQLQVGFATAIDGRVDRIVPNLAVVRPTFMGAAPRIFEKAYGRIVTMARAEGGAKARIFDWACGVGRTVSRLRQQGSPLPWHLTVRHRIADRLVFAKVRERFGGRLRFFVSGSAALSQEVAEWFHAAGILILEGYGLTETSAGSLVNRPECFRFGTVGLPFPGTEVRLAEDGEVLIKGPGVMDGYHNLEQETRHALLDDGWLATGDIGEIDADGFLRITDRKKDLFKTSGGKYVSPSYIEGLFKGICPLASQMVVHGDGRNYCVALIALDPDAVQEWAARHDMATASYAQVVMSEAMRREIGGYVDELNTRLNRWESIKKFAFLDRDLSVDAGELTPSLKVKRRVVEHHYRDALDALYDSPSPVS